MIRIVRPADRSGFVAGGEHATQALIDERAADPAAGGSKKRTFKFSGNIYGPKKIKDVLKATQHEKCCFCENYFAGNYPGDVEHFRPKAYAQQGRRGLITYPGYFRLAYRWENLLYSCYSCNAQAKRNLFPVADPTQRAAIFEDIGNEGAILIDPAIEDPRVHINFDFLLPKGTTPRGAATIEILKLDRDELKRPRLSHLKHLDAHLKLARLPNTPKHAANRALSAQVLAEAIEPTGLFSSMSIDYLVKQGWHPVNGA